MDIYKHKKEGLVILVEGCEVKGKFGKWTKGVIYRRAQGDMSNASEFKGKMQIESEYRVMNIRAWKQNVKRVGTAYVGEEGEKKAKEQQNTTVLGQRSEGIVETRTQGEIDTEMRAHMAEVERKKEEDRKELLDEMAPSNTSDK